MLALAAPTFADVPEYQLKAAYLYNFATFTDWPPNAADQMAICVLGRDPFGPVLDALAGKSAHGLPLHVRRIETIDNARSCRVVFVGTDSGVDLAATLTTLKGRPVLTVAEDRDAVRAGAVIGLVNDGGRILFDINTAAARDGGLVLSSKLLRLARQLYPAP